MGPVQAITTCLRKTFHFSGRASRPEFWWFAPPWLVFTLLPTILLTPETAGKEQVLAVFFVRVALCLPVLSVAARRVVDAGFDPTWIGWGFSGIFFGLGLHDIVSIAPPQAQTAWMPPAATAILSLSALSLAYVLTRPSKPGPNPLEVTP